MTSLPLFAFTLAAACLSGPWVRKEIVKRLNEANGKRRHWLSLFATRLLEAFPNPPPGSQFEKLLSFIKGDQGFQNAWMRYGNTDRPRPIFWVSPQMLPASAKAAGWGVPALATLNTLAEWLGLTRSELEWFADCHGRSARERNEPLRHYRYRAIRKSAGRYRVLEIPKPRLKEIQQKVLREILDRVPVHDAAHGFRRRRSIATFAKPHCGKRVVLRFDLKNFFPSVQASRVHAIFRFIGYPPEVARRLTGLCTNVVPDQVWSQLPKSFDPAKQWDDLRPYRVPHLPQGSPTSPALANLAAYRLDCRFYSLAKSLGAVYTRYADDLAFSGDRDLERSLPRLRVLICTIALEEGFEINLRKARVMREAVRQQLVGVVVNAHLNRPRAEYDRLKAILTNCIRHGPAAQNREYVKDFRAHLLGRVAHWTMINPHRGGRLRKIFEQIEWTG